MLGLLRHTGFLIALGFLAACASATKPEPDTLPESPSPVYKDLISKVRQHFPADRYLVGIGQGTSDKAATELARADLVKKIRVDVRMLQMDVLRERGGETEQDLTTLVETEVAELVGGIEIVEQGKDPKTGEAYAVAVLPKVEMERILRGPRGQSQRILPSPVPLESKDGIWVTGEGIVSFGEDTTLAEARSRARDEARRHAIEQAVGVFVRGQTVVYNAQVAEDLVNSLVRGIVVEEQILEEGVRQLGQGPGAPAFQYATKLRAKVKPVRAEHRGDFRVTATINKTVYQDGEEMQIAVDSSKDAYVHIFNVGQDDTVTVLFPNRYVQNSFVEARKELVFPDEAQRALGIRLRVFPPAGVKTAVEKIKLIATRHKLDLLKGKVPEGVYRIYPGKDTNLVTVLLRELALLNDSDWAEMTLPYEVRR